jgi:hypothetical protein
MSVFLVACGRSHLSYWNIVTGRCSSAIGGDVIDAADNSDFWTRGSICGGHEIVHREMLALLNRAA